MAKKAKAIAPPTPPKHACRWKHSGWSGRGPEFRCAIKGCPASTFRAFTKEEQRWYTKYHSIKAMFPPEKSPKNVHRAYHDFKKKFREPRDGQRDAWVSIGYPLIRDVEKWARKWPDHVKVIRVDDNVNAGSRLVFITSKTARRFHGTSVVFIPQCTGEDPSIFFLYDHHSADLVATLKAIDKDRKAVVKLQKADHRQHDREWAALLKKNPGPVLRKAKT